MYQTFGNIEENVEIALQEHFPPLSRHKCSNVKDHCIEFED